MLTYVASCSQSKNICRIVVRSAGGRRSIPLFSLRGWQDCSPAGGAAASAQNPYRHIMVMYGCCRHHITETLRVYSPLPGSLKLRLKATGICEAGGAPRPCPGVLLSTPGAHVPASKRLCSAEGVPTTMVTAS